MCRRWALMHRGLCQGNISSVTFRNNENPVQIGPPRRIAENRHTPRSIDICAMINQDFDNLHIATRTGGMEGKDAIEDRVYGLAVVEGILDEPDIASSGGRVEAKTGN